MMVANAMVKRLVGLLIDKYENSKSYKDQALGQRKIALTPKSVKGLNFEDYEQKDAFISALNLLREMGVADFEWQPYETGNLIKRFWLKQETEGIEIAYKLLGRPATYSAKSQVMDYLRLCDFNHYDWMKVYKGEVLSRFERTGKYGNLLMSDDDTSMALIKLLHALDQRCGEPIHERLLSVSVLGDTKAFQKFFKIKLKALTCRYAMPAEVGEDALSGDEAMNEAGDDGLNEAGDDGLNEAGALSLLGVYSNPETLLFYGDITLHFKKGTFDAVVFSSGASLLGRSVPEIQAITGCVDQVLFIENLACYEMALSGDYPMLRNQITAATLLIYQGGFSSNIQRLFYTKLFKTFPNARYRLWSDIDLGGARIYANLQQVIPSLQTLFMDLETLIQYNQYCVNLTPGYAVKVSQALARALADSDSLPDYVRLLTLLHNCQKRLEQESLGLRETQNKEGDSNESR